MKYRLLDILFKSEIISEAFKRAEQLNLPNWYIGAGCIAQTIWNHFHGFDPESFINDIDLVYFDSVDLSFEAEDGFIRKAAEYFKGFSIPIDIKNQARVHLWFEDKFGYNIAPYPFSCAPITGVESATRTPNSRACFKYPLAIP